MLYRSFSTSFSGIEFLVDLGAAPIFLETELVLVGLSIFLLVSAPLGLDATFLGCVSNVYFDLAVASFETLPIL